MIPSMRKLFFLFSILFSEYSHAQPGVLYDNTFGRYSGLEVTRISQGTAYHDMQVQADGKPVCAGTYFNGLLNQPAVVRYKINGDLDSTFGIDGVAASFLTNADVLLYAMSLQPDGKIAVAGYTTNTSPGATDFLIARYNTNGYPDSSFGANGYVIIDAGPFQDWLHDIKIKPDGKVVAAGYTFNGQHYVFAAVQYNTDGTPDNTFSEDGLALVDANVSNSQCLGLALQQDGKILLAGFSNDVNEKPTFTVARLKLNGTADSSFGANGIVYPYSPGVSERLEDIIVLPDGKIVAAGESVISSTYRSDFTLVKMNTDGSPDMSFGAAGLSQINLWNTLSIPRKMALQSDLKIIVAGYINSPNNVPGDVVLLRFNANGTLDTAFDTDGDIGGDGTDPDNSYLGTAVALWGQRIYVAGSLIPFPSASPRSGFIIAAINSGSPIALNLINFNVVRKESGIQLFWQTGAGTPSEFVVEKSTDGTRFAPIGKVMAVAQNIYSFTDTGALEAVCFYRIKIIEPDGSYTYSPIATATGHNTILQTAVFPNPAKNILSLSVSGQKGHAIVQVAASDGRIVRETKVTMQGNTVCSFDVSFLPPGAYYLRLISSGGSRCHRFLKL